MDSERPPYIKTVYFDLPFVLFLKDNVKDRELEKWWEAVKNGEPPPYCRYAPPPNKPATTIIGGGIPVYIPPDELAEPYYVDLGDIQCVIRLLKRVNPHNDMVGMGELPGDRAGRTSFSSVECRFDPRYVPETSEDMGLWVQYAIKCINHLIQHYRVVANREYLYPVTKNVIGHFLIGTEHPDDKVTHQTYLTGSGALNGFGGSIDSDSDLQLRARISKPNPPLVAEILFQDINSRLELGEYRLAVIEGAVLFESFLVGTLQNTLKSQGKTPEEIDSVFHYPDGRPHEIIHIAKAVFREVTGKDFAATNEFRDWRESSCLLRNNIVHGRIYDVTWDEAIDALRKIDAAVQKIRKMLGIQ